MGTTTGEHRPTASAAIGRGMVQGLFDGLVIRLTQAEEELSSVDAVALIGVDDPLLADDRDAVRACLTRMLRRVEGVAA